MTWKPYCIPSIAVALMHPLVEQPVRIIVSILRLLRVEASEVPKKLLFPFVRGCCGLPDPDEKIALQVSAEMSPGDTYILIHG